MAVIDIPRNRNNDTTPLSPSADWLRIAQCVDQFEAERTGSGMDLRSFVVDCPRAMQPAALAELARIDMELDARIGNARLAADYLVQYPEINTDPALVAELERAESIWRRQWTPIVVHRTQDEDSVTPALSQVMGDALASSPASQPGKGNADSSPKEGSTAGRYRLLRELGAGGMGTVYLAEDVLLGRKVALKIPNLTERDGAELHERFQREAQAAASLHHPNICPVYDVGVRAGVPYLTMAYIDGHSLCDVVNSGERLPIALTVRMIIGIARGLEEAHRHGVLHRDLKPANILVNDRGEPVITDFGLAWLERSRDSHLTRVGAAIGTPAYMSPEHWRGDEQAKLPTCDIYSLGVLFYQLLTGKLPFTGSAPEILEQQTNRAPQPPSQLNPEIDNKLEAICLKAMARRAQDRYQTAASLAAALSDYLHSQQNSSSRSSISGSSWRRWVSAQWQTPMFTRRRLAWAVSLSLFVVAGLLGVTDFAGLRSLVGMKRGTPENPLALQSPSKAGNASTSLPVTGAEVEGQAASVLGQIPMADSGQQAIDLQVLLQRENEPANYRILGSRTGPVRPNDKLRIHANWNAASYAYLYWYDAEGRPQRLWPMDPTRQQKISNLWNPELRPGSQQQLWHQVGGKPGREMILLATSQTPLSAEQLARFEEKLVDLQGVAPEALAQATTVRSPTNQDRVRGPVSQVPSNLGRQRVLPEAFEHELESQFDSFAGLVFPFE